MQPLNHQLLVVLLLMSKILSNQLIMVQKFNYQFLLIQMEPQLLLVQNHQNRQIRHHHLQFLMFILFAKNLRILQNYRSFHPQLFDYHWLYQLMQMDHLMNWYFYLYQQQEMRLKRLLKQFMHYFKLLKSLQNLQNHLRYELIITYLNF